MTQGSLNVEINIPDGNIVDVLERIEAELKGGHKRIFTSEE